MKLSAVVVALVLSVTFNQCDAFTSTHLPRVLRSTARPLVSRPSPSGGVGLRPADGALRMVKEQADSVPLPLAKGLEQAFDDLIGKVYSLLKYQELISGAKFPPIESRFIQIMKKYDASKSGGLKIEEFRDMVADGFVWRDLLLPQSTSFGKLPPCPTKPEIDKIFKDLDVDGNGSLDARELTNALDLLGLQVEEGEKDLSNAITLKGSDSCNWRPAAIRVEQADVPISLKPWGAPLEALLRDDFGAAKTMALFNAIKLADGAYGQFNEIVAGTWTGAPPNIKGFIPRLLKIAAALGLLEQHYTTCAAWQEDSDFDDEFGEGLDLKEAYTNAQDEVAVLKRRLAGLMYLLVVREGAVPLLDKEKAHVEMVLNPLGVDIPDEVNYKGLAKILDEDGLSQRMWQGNLLDELDEGAKDFAAYFRLRKSGKTDLKAFEDSCYGESVANSMKTVLKKQKPGKEDLVLAELQALQALPC